MDVDFILRHPTPANALMGDKDGNPVMTIGNYKEEMTKNAITYKSEPSREDMR